MAIRGFAAAVSLAVIFASGVAWAGPAQPNAKDQIAYFQTKNIFHSGLRGTHTIALTFDDGPNANTPAVLDVLKAQNVKATFFIVGKMARAYPDILRRIAAEGHLLANHSATHPLLGKKYVRHPEMLIDQIRAVDDYIRPLMPANAKFYFRAPYGSWRPQHAAVLNADPVLKQYVGPMYWDIGGDIAMSSDGYVLSAADWDCWHRHWDADTCAKGYMREIRRKDGGVVLMHCIHQQSPELVAAVVPALVEEGYKFVRLDQVPDYKQYETPTTPVIAIASAEGATAARR
ncbi:MAG TPA: polysaccharide deacetylase family protein [Rhizomicrobium sp.]|jgi:peptidoglycan/xylan/chitin deacetylase (PgdA/CDA1 family)